MSTIIKNGTIITASDTVQADVLIEGEKVVLIGQKLPTTAGLSIMGTRMMVVQKAWPRNLRSIR